MPTKPKSNKPSKNNGLMKLHLLSQQLLTAFVDSLSIYISEHHVIDLATDSEWDGAEEEETGLEGEEFEDPEFEVPTSFVQSQYSHL